MNAILTMSTFIFPLISYPYVARILGKVGVGKVAFAASVITYFTMFAQLGIPTYGIRACAKVRDDREELSRTAHELLFINIVMTVASYILLAVGIILVPKLQEEKTLLVITSITIILSAIGMEWLYQALEQYVFITVRSVIFKAIAIVALFLLVKEQNDYVIYGAITIFASSASYIMNFIHAHKFISMRPVGGYNPKRHLKFVMIFFAMACATTIYTNLDVVMLGFMKTDGDVGYYNSAVRIKMVLVSIVTSLGAVLLPRASYYIEHGMKDEFKKITGKALNFVFLLASPLALYFILFAREGVLLFAGGDFEGSILPMQIIMPTLLLIGITNVLGIQILVPLGREKVVLQSEIAGAVTDIILNAIFIPHFAASGAAFGTLIAEIVVMIVQIVALRHDIGEAFKKISYIRIILGMAIGFAACFWVKFMGFGNFISLLISAVIFFLVYLAFMYITKESLTREIIGQVIDKVKSKLKKA